MSGRAMKDSGIEWKKIKIKYMVKIHNGKDHQHITSEDGTYPIYGTGGIFAYGSDYLFEGPSVLLGRKGTIDNPLYVRGKFWSVDTAFYSMFKVFVST